METLFQNKRHTPKAVRADFKGGLEDGKQAEDTRKDQTAWFPVLQLTTVSSHGSVLPYGCGLSMSKPGTVAAGGTSSNTPSSYGGVWLCSLPAVSSGAAQWSQWQAGPRIHQGKDRRTYSHTKRKGGRGTEQESSPPWGRRLPRYKVPSSSEYEILSENMTYILDTSWSISGWHMHLRSPLKYTKAREGTQQ